MKNAEARSRLDTSLGLSHGSEAHVGGVVWGEMILDAGEEGINRPKI